MIVLMINPIISNIGLVFNQWKNNTSDYGVFYLVLNFLEKENFKGDIEH